MLTLYDNPFSPFARKVRMALWIKGVPFESIDALAVGERERLLRVNPRGEVPVLVDGDVTVVDSCDIAAYLEDRFPTPPLLPPSPSARATARSWQRIADGPIDAIVHDVSLWVWPTHRRADPPPPGLLEAGRRDLATILARLEAALERAPFLCGEPCIADLALFPHLSSLRLLGISLDPFPSVLRWNRELRRIPAVRTDLDFVKRSAIEKFASGASPYEGQKVVWRGDRIEWLLAHGFEEWFHAELACGRAVVPDPVQDLAPGLAASVVEVVPFRADLEDRVVDLVLGIQRDEFGMQITAEQQPDLRQIPTFYQVGNGNFWVAVSGSDVVGTIALLDIGPAQGALRKMFVDRRFRGGRAGTARRLLDTLVGWSAERGVSEILLGTTPHFRAAHRFYEKNGFREIAKSSLPPAFPVMEVDTRFYRRSVEPAAR